MKTFSEMRFIQNIVTYVQYDRFGRKTQKGTTGGKIINYEYDIAGRVISERHPGVNNRYTQSVFGITAIKTSTTTQQPTHTTQ